MMTAKMEDKLNTLMRNWWNGNLSEAKRQTRNLNKRELTQLLINQHQLKNGAWSKENILKIQDFVVESLQ